MAALRAIAALEGTRNGRRYDERLAEEIVAHARVRQSAGDAQRIIAEELGISQPTLSKVLRRESKLIPVKVVARLGRERRAVVRSAVLRPQPGAVAEQQARRIKVEAEYEARILEARAEVSKLARQASLLKEQLAAVRDAATSSAKIAQLAQSRDSETL